MMAAKRKAEPDDAPHGSTRSMRDCAEEQLVRVPKRSSDLKVLPNETLVHELQVHQIELEMQAEQLRATQLALEESRDKYLDLYEFAPIGYLTISDKALITDVNLTGTTLFAVDRSRLVNHGLGGFIAPGDHENWDQYFIKVQQQEEGKQTCTLTLKRGDGIVFPARLEGVRIKGRDGVITIRIAISDITDIWQIKALRASEEQYRRLFETSQDGILILDEATGTIIDVNTYLLDLLGHQKEYFVGKQLWEVGFIKDKSVAQHAFAELKKNGYIRYEDLPLETKDGRSMDVEFISNVYRVGNREIIQCNIRDITARKRTEEALALASRKLTLLSSITRHDINNQLLVLNGFLDYLHREVVDPNLEPYFTRVITASSQISAMIRFTKEYEKIGVNAPVWQDCSTLVDTAAKQAPLGT
ncbi:MAG: PAS domain S-box protein, partial [Methanoregula sp.]|nr:PAS domain S-box protein [Methanoregula sp.]